MQSTWGEGGAPTVRPMCADGAPMVPNIASIREARVRGVGLRWSGSDGLYLDTTTNHAVTHDEAQTRIAGLGLKWTGESFIDIKGVPVAWKDAQAMISGTGLERTAA